MGFSSKIFIIALISIVRSEDINLGSERGRKIFDEDTTANPAIWRQVNNVTITVGDNDVIGGLNIKDLREDKKGEAVVVDGGIGQKNITIELKSPTALRGYEFHIQAYAIPESEADTIKNQGQPQINSGKTLNAAKNIPPVPRLAANDGKTTLRTNHPTGSTTQADSAKTETKRSAEASTAKTVGDNAASSTPKYPSTKMQDNQATKTTLDSLQKTESKRSADDSLIPKLSTENNLHSTTPQYHSIPIKTFDHVDDKMDPNHRPLTARDYIKTDDHQSTKNPSTKTQDNQGNKTLSSLEKTETKRSADDSLNTKLSTEQNLRSTTPQYHSTPIKTFERADNKMDSKHIPTPRDHINPDAEHQSNFKTSRSVHDDTPSTVDGKSTQADTSSKTPEAIPVHQFLMNHDSADTNKPSDDAIVSSHPVEVKLASSTTESSKDGTKVYTHKPVSYSK